jgi:hypothetical protein
MLPHMGQPAHRPADSRLRVLFVSAIAGLIGFGVSNVLAAEGAAIRLPEDFAANATRIEFSGFGGYNRGTYAGGNFTGEYARTESRLGLFDPLLVANRGRSSFSVEDQPDIGGLSASCRAAQDVGNLRSVTLDLRKLTYRCEFSGIADAEQWQFALGEPRRSGLKEKLLAYERRRGEAFVLGEEILIDSVHNYAGTPLGSQSPLGYVLESNGVAIAAVDLLDWNPVVHLREGLRDSVREAAMIVALSLAVLRDPANSALED